MSGCFCQHALATFLFRRLLGSNEIVCPAGWGEICFDLLVQPHPFLPHVATALPCHPPSLCHLFIVHYTAIGTSIVAVYATNGGILPIFRLFSAYGTPSAVFPHTCLRNLPISAYFPPKMVPHPCYKLKHGTHLLFFRPHVYGFCRIPLIFRLFSA